jgi:CelD/BcsL family acetyltransferase involved in cellulose biosynthesis
MSKLRLVRLRTPAALEKRASDWDCLWRRSEVTIPTAQARHVAGWLTQFAVGRSFRALAVEEKSGQLVAALSLVSERWGGIMPCGALTSNAWTPAGELLVDPESAVDDVLDVLVRGLARLPWQLFWLDWTVLDAPRWRAFIEACGRAGLATAQHERYRIPRIDTAGKWESYRSMWSGQHRRNMTRHRRGLQAERGAVRLRWISPTPEQVGPLLRRGWELENRSWKGAARESVLRVPGMSRFFQQQASLLAERQQLRLAFLEAGGEAVAFQYGWWAKGVYHPFKCGYDPSLREFGPGQLLMHDVLAELFASQDAVALDGVGPATAATDKWKPASYALGRLVVAPPRLLGRSLMYAYEHIWPALRAWRGGGGEIAGPQIVAATTADEDRGTL